MVNTTERSPRPIQPASQDTGEVFIGEKKNTGVIHEAWEKVVEIVKRFSHQQYEYMPRVLTVGELITIILDQNDHLKKDDAETVDLAGNYKQYMVGLSGTKDEHLVHSLNLSDQTIEVNSHQGEDDQPRILQKDQEIRFTMIENEQDRSSQHA